MISFRSPKKIISGSFISLLLIWLTLCQSCMRFRTADSDARVAFVNKNIPISFDNIDFNGVRIHYAKTGGANKPTLFFVHGSPGSWDAFSTYLSDSSLLLHFRMISIDRPGFGYSNFGDALPLEEQAKAIGAVLKKENNAQPVHLIGHSLGGPVVVKLAQDHPENYQSLNILSGSISPSDEPKEYWRYIFAYSPLKYLIPGAFRPSNIEIVYFKKDLKELDKYWIKVTHPVTFIHGDADTFVTVKNVAYGQKKLVHNKNVKTIIIPGASHFIPWQYFDSIQKHLLTLVSSKN